MLHEQLAEYLEQIDKALSGFTSVYVESYRREVLTSRRLNIQVRLRFPQGELFEFNEAVIFKAGKLQHLNYRYHLQDKKRHCVFRYDNTPHHPEVETFPEHKHMGQKCNRHPDPPSRMCVKKYVYIWHHNKPYSVRSHNFRPGRTWIFRVEGE